MHLEVRGHLAEASTLLLLPGCQGLNKKANRLSRLLFYLQSSLISL